MHHSWLIHSSGYETYIVLDATARANDGDEESYQRKLENMERKGESSIMYNVYYFSNLYILV